MQIHRNYKYRLYPNKSQIDLLNSHFFSSNQAWNFMLDFKIKELNNQKSLDKKDRKYTNFNDLYEDLDILHRWSNSKSHNNFHLILF